MKLKKDYVLRQMAGTWMVVPLAETEVDFSCMLKLNESATMLWKILEKGGDRQKLVDALLGEYDVTPVQAEADVDAFLNKLIQAGCMQESADHESN